MSKNLIAAGVCVASHWRSEHVAAICRSDNDGAPLIRAEHVVRVSPQLDVWDAWPVQTQDGYPIEAEPGETLWMALGAPRFSDPDERHGHARIHLIGRAGEAWIDYGPAMPDGFSPGSREWSGSAVLEADGSTVTLYFTASGRRGEAALSFEQRIFRARSTLTHAPHGWRLVAWRQLEEIVERDPALYMASDSGSGKINTIKAYRDPAFFHDPANGRDYLLFAASQANSLSAFNGVIGAASRDGDDDDWGILPPIVTADGLNNELERPHVVHHHGLYYLFWSTQQHVFDPQGPIGPTGLYGMVAESMRGPWAPLNGTGLVFANPLAAPRQAYSWLVMPDLQVTSFIDDWGHGEADNAERQFGATFAPMLRLQVSGPETQLVG